MSIKFTFTFKQDYGSNVTKSQTFTFAADGSNDLQITSDNTADLYLSAAYGAEYPIELSASYCDSNQNLGSWIRQNVELSAACTSSDSDAFDSTYTGDGPYFVD